MRVKRLTLMLWGLSMIVFCVALYKITEQLYSTTDNKADFRMNQWLHIKDSKPTIQEDDDILGDEPKPILQVAAPQKEIPIFFKNQSKPNRSILSQCTDKMATLPKNDIQMLDVYSRIKFDNVDGGVWKQGYDITYDQQQWNQKHKLKVFIVPHSHNDPGWLKTFEEYYAQQTASILNGMVTKLAENSRRKFIWAEISYFALWWNEISDDFKRQVKEFLQSGQLEIVTGGWVMNDEANSHWISIAQQLTTGHQWMKENINITPKFSWAIDPFGHSSTQPYLLKLAGLQAGVIQRVHYRIKKELALSRQLEFSWRQTWDDKGTTDFFTHLMPFYSYDIPHTCGPDPKICCQFDFKRLPSFGLSCPWRVPPKQITDRNIEERSKTILDQWRKKSQLYKTQVVLVPLGDDFRWSHVTEWDIQFKNYEKLLDYLNSNPELNVVVKFGTLSDYFREVQKELHVHDIPILSGDFFTYADRNDDYWSGYYTSRPVHKRLDRTVLGYVRAAEIIHALASRHQSSESEFSDRLLSARRSLALFQHHDGVTGTAKNHVVEDYGRKLLKAINDCQWVIQHSAYQLLAYPDKSLLNGRYLIPEEQERPYFEVDDVRRDHWSMSERLVITIGQAAPSRLVTLYNPLSFSRVEMVTLHVSTPLVLVVNSKGTAVKSQVSPIFINDGIPTETKYLLVFEASVPALGLSSYIVTAVAHRSQAKSTIFGHAHLFNYNGPEINLPSHFKISHKESVSHITLKLTTKENQKITFTSAGLMTSYTDDDGTEYPIDLGFITYGTKRGESKSGAYLFIPNGPATVLKARPNRMVSLVEGPYMSTLHVKLDHVYHIVTLYGGSGPNSLGIEVTNIVDITQTENFELGMRLTTGIQNKDYFTDLNGFQMIRRHNFTKLPTQANFYPMPEAAYLEDDQKRVTVLTATPLGVASLKSGEIEIIQDRKLSFDDDRGLSQGINDNHPVEHIFRILLEKRTCQSSAPNHPSGVLSIAAHVASQGLLQPIVKLLYSSDSATPDLMGLTNLYTNIMKKEPGFDLVIASYRDNVLASDSNGRSLTGRGLILHRPHIDGCVGTPDLISRFPLSNGQVDLKSILPISADDTVRKSTLTFLHIGSSIDTSVPHQLCPMDVNSYFIH